MELPIHASTQISDGLTQTSADGVHMAFDSKYGIMFCIYMPGPQGRYGESRGRITLTYFPASQPTNTRTVDIACGHDEYNQNIISLGDGKVRILYETDSRADGDHLILYKDYDYLTDTLTEPRTLLLHREDGTTVPLTTTEQMAYLEKRGFKTHFRLDTEQINLGGHTIFKGEDGCLYGSVTSYYAEPILYRSRDEMQSVEFFAVVPYTSQYELDYKYLNGKIYALVRTEKEQDAILYATSEDNGETWSDAIPLKDSIQCRPRVILYHGHILMAYNYYDPNTGNRPSIQQGRTAIRMWLGENANPYENTLLADLHSKYGIVNICLADILGELYMAYSTSILSLEYQNGNPLVRGKDAVRYINLGDLTEVPAI